MIPSPVNAVTYDVSPPWLQRRGYQSCICHTPCESRHGGLGQTPRLWTGRQTYIEIGLTLSLTGLISPVQLGVVLPGKLHQVDAGHGVVHHKVQRPLNAPVNIGPGRQVKNNLTKNSSLVLLSLRRALVSPECPRCPWTAGH